MNAILPVSSILTLLALFMAGVSTTANATVVTAGGVGSGDCTYPCTPTIQQVYLSSLFGTQQVTIDSVANFANGFGNYGSTWDIFLSTSQNPVGSINESFAANRGSDQQFFGSVSLSGTLNALDLVTFNGSFLYNPSAGDLLVEWVRTSGSDLGGGFQGVGGTGEISRVFSFSAFATVGSVSQDFGIATQFSFSPVPEPSTMLLTGSGLAGLGFFRRRKKWDVSS